MIEEYSQLYVGNQADYDNIVAYQSDWAVVHACKEPYHRDALGYVGRAVSRQHPEYLVARRGDRLILNIADADNPMFFSKDGLIVPALDFITDKRAEGKSVLIHRNLGESRSPAIALLYMATRLQALPNESLSAAEGEFRKLYPAYNPKPGIRGHLQQFWPQYCAEGAQHA